MATQTFQHSAFGGCQIEFDINDANWRMSQVRCINNSSHQAMAIILESGITRLTAIAPPNQTTNWNTTGVQLGWDQVNGGLMMGNYVLQIQFPAS
jgi:hypothetical protein